MELFRRYTTTTSEEYISVVINGYKQGTHYNLKYKNVAIYLNDKCIISAKYSSERIHILSYKSGHMLFHIFWSNSGIINYISLYKDYMRNKSNFCWELNGESIKVTH